MKKILITGGTTFVSKFAASYFIERGDEVYVINRNTKPQAEGTILINSDRHALGNKLKGIHFDAVLDITAYNATDISSLYHALGAFDIYVMISSSAVYSDQNTLPFSEESFKGPNAFWGRYGTDKLQAENLLLQNNPDSYILRPPYLYGPMNNIYREAFVFDCAMADRRFYLPRTGEMKLQFFHVRDLCRVMETIIDRAPSEHILNVGNESAVTIRDWVAMCYACFGKTPEFTYVNSSTEQRKYFCFYDYAYFLDVKKQRGLLSDTISLSDGLKESAAWYAKHMNDVIKKPYLEFIDANMI